MNFSVFQNGCLTYFLELPESLVHQARNLDQDVLVSLLTNKNILVRNLNLYLQSESRSEPTEMHTKKQNVQLLPAEKICSKHW